MVSVPKLDLQQTIKELGPNLSKKLTVDDVIEVEKFLQKRELLYGAASGLARSYIQSRERKAFESAKCRANYPEFGQEFEDYKNSKEYLDE